MPYFDYDHVTHQLHESVQNTSLQKIAMAGTGLTPLTNSPTAHGTIEGPLVLELVHLTEIGVSALALEGIRQERAHIIHQRRLSTVRFVTRGERLQEQEQILPEYPRERLKLVLTDGFNELEAIECGRLPDIVLGKTPMGTKVRLLIPLVSTWYI
ncbi:hypothetical protein FA13DRAFT_1641002 [Coprinellus micaceus]|uniref:RecQ mediated genome instability protein 1 OB-fold domain-containing protein n=1 Tax=Coprinellus micaceus TaxID=71717 RepID=A0A4Y7SLN6_COPMI|nr:hypothetical protein FA13DRAFT_1641002 [Coprinellus micaceus]